MGPSGPPEEAPKAAPDAAQAKDDKHERAVEQFRERLREVERRDDVRFTAAAGYVTVDGEVRRVWTDPARSPRKETRRQVAMMAPLFGWATTPNGKLSGRQWKKLRKRALRHQREEERRKKAEGDG